MWHGLPVPRAFLIHWSEGEAKEHAWRVRRLGWSVRIAFRQRVDPTDEILQSPPDAVLIYLSRLPSHGAHVAEHLVESEATRRVPIVFVDGEPEDVKKLSQEFPRAVFTTSEELAQTLASLAED